MRQILPQKNSFLKTQAFFHKTKYFFSKNKIQENIPQIYATWAKTKKDIKEVQKLRYKVFAKEMGAKIPGRIDKDIYDDFCEHLIIRDAFNGKVVGTYRVLTQENKRKIGRFYTESEFKLNKLITDNESVVELGRACVHKDYRNGAVIISLWSELGKFMKANNYEKMIGCSSISLLDGGQYASDVYNYLSIQNKINYNYGIEPKRSFDVLKYSKKQNVQLPSLLKGYIRIGAEVCGNPAYDENFRTADFFTLFDINKINEKYAKRFLK